MKLPKMFCAEKSFCFLPKKDDFSGVIYHMFDTRYAPGTLVLINKGWMVDTRIHEMGESAMGIVMSHPEREDLETWRHVRVLIHGRVRLIVRGGLRVLRVAGDENGG